MYTCIHCIGKHKIALIDTLRDHILNGTLRPGAELLQTDLAARFGVSRFPVRDALQALAAERLVRVIPNKGAQVIALTGTGLMTVALALLTYELAGANVGAILGTALAMIANRPTESIDIAVFLLS